MGNFLKSIFAPNVGRVLTSAIVTGAIAILSYLIVNLATIINPAFPNSELVIAVLTIIFKAIQKSLTDIDN
jgi:hypothetical protein